ncbi:hypothetical protein Y032_0030g2213 [Ancylostoma ceylanicum]|nr:hypothetical protein Y032_0030g2213 [Ancylostoma ceylanicum]
MKLRSFTSQTFARESRLKKKLAYHFRDKIRSSGGRHHFDFVVGLTGEWCENVIHNRSQTYQSFKPTDKVRCEMEWGTTSTFIDQSLDSALHLPTTLTTTTTTQQVSSSKYVVLFQVL